MLAALVVFVILALIFGIGCAIEISLWFLLLVVLAALLAAFLGARFLRGKLGGRR